MALRPLIKWVAILIPYHNKVQKAKPSVILGCVESRRIDQAREKAISKFKIPWLDGLVIKRWEDSTTEERDQALEAEALSADF